MRLGVDLVSGCAGEEVTSARREIEGIDPQRGVPKEVKHSLNRARGYNKVIGR